MHENVVKFVIWICKHFNREQVKVISDKLLEILKDPNSEIQPKDTFKEDHPNYRKFDVDPKPPLKQKPGKKKRKYSGKNF